MQSLLFLIVRTHFDSPLGCQSTSTLLHDITYWGKTGISRENAKFHLVKPLLVESFRARVLALWYDILVEHRWLSRRDNAFDFRKDEIDTALERMTPKQFLETVKHIQNTVFNQDGWTGHQHRDKEHTSFCRLMQEIEMFLLLDHSIKAGDVGMLWRMVAPLSAMFYGAEQYEYGLKMLHLRWLLSDQLADQELQESIIASGLVNLSGREGNWKPIDLALEHINASYSIDMKMHKNSTHDVQKTFGRYPLVSTYTSILRDIIEHNFRELTRSKHSPKNGKEGVFNLATHLCNEAVSIIDRNHSHNRRFISLDILTAGLEMLPEKIWAFNHGISEESEPIEQGTAHEAEMCDDDAAISAFVDAVEELQGSGEAEHL